MKKHYKITVEGRVQGVWFRKYTLEKALSLAITGYVMNKPNGTVFIEAEATTETLHLFIDWLQTSGSPLSQVSSVHVEETDLLKNYSTFEIRR